MPLVKAPFVELRFIFSGESSENATIYHQSPARLTPTSSENPINHRNATQFNRSADKDDREHYYCARELALPMTVPYYQRVASGSYAEYVLQHSIYGCQTGAELQK